jgi:archaeosine-15-forming tRNA-guanine transglycosylase
MLLLSGGLGLAANDPGELVVQQGHSAQVRQVVASAKQGLAASRGDDNTIRIWDLAARMLVRTIAATNVDAMALGCLHPWLILAREGGLRSPPVVELWDLQQGRVERTLLETNFFTANSMPSAFVKSIVLSPDGGFCAVAVDPGAVLTADAVDAVYVLECSSGRLVGAVKARNAQRSFGGIESVAFSADGKSLFLVAFGALQTASIKQKEATEVRPLDARFPHGDFLAVSPKGGPSPCLKVKRCAKTSFLIRHGRVKQENRPPSGFLCGESAKAILNTCLRPRPTSTAFASMIRATICMRVPAKAWPHGA